MSSQRNVLGEPLEPCCFAPVTGFNRNGYCETGPQDIGIHTVCAEMTREFLDFSLESGNDLSTPRPEFRFHGLLPGNRWCICAERWKEAFDAGVAPRVILAATHEETLEIVSLQDLMSHAIDLE